MFPLHYRLARTSLLLRTILCRAGLPASGVLVGRGAVSSVGGLVLLSRLTRLTATLRQLGFIPVGAGLVLGSTSESFVFPPLRPSIVHSRRAPTPRFSPAVGG